MLQCLVIVACLLSGASELVRGERILLLPIQIRANIYRHLAIAGHLEKRGNDVYMAVPDHFPWQTFSQSASVELIRYTQRDNETLYDSRLPDLLADDVNEAKNVFRTPLRAEEYLSTTAAKMCGWMLSDKEFLHQVEFMNFHVALIDGPDQSPCNVLIPALFGIPFVLISSNYPPPAVWIHFPSFVPDMTSPYSDSMTFWQRLDNLHTHRRLRISGTYGSVPDQQLLTRFRNERKSGPVTWSELIANASMFITLRDHVLDWPVPTLPNHVTLPGGLQQPGKTLPSELDAYLSESSHGVILVSFGSLYSRLDLDLIRRLFSAFRRIDFHGYRFLMKLDPKQQHEAASLPGGVPGNVWIVTWIPQNDVLAHPKTKLFISHCGNNGQYEALYHGVPLVCLPLYDDQYHNCIRIHEKRFGICLDTWNFAPESLAHSCSVLLNQRSFKERISRISGILKHGSLPSQSAAFWIEHVAKHGGSHLQSGASYLSYNELWMIDIMFYYLFIVLSAIASALLLLFFALSIYKNKIKME